MSRFVRTLNIRSQDLGRDTTLVLAFNDEKIPGLYHIVFPIVWKVAKFGASGSYYFKARFSSDVGVTKAEISGGIVSTSLYTHLNSGNKVALKEKGDPPVYYFSEEQSNPPTHRIIVANETRTRQNIGLGFFQSPDDPAAPAQVLVYESVSPGSVVQSEFTPILAGYITTDFRESQILRGQISSPIIFKQNLVELDEETNWKLEYNPGTGQYIITRDYDL